MNIGVELVPEKALTMAAGDYIRMWLWVDGVRIDATEGYDYFEHTATILAGKRLAATGRSSRFRVSDHPLGLGAYEVEASTVVSCPLASASCVHLEISASNSVLMDPGLLVDHIGVKLLGTQHEQLFPLQRPDIRIDWLERGHFTLDITPLVRLGAAGRA
ncbi:MAG: hypothetical protein AB1497_12040 [Bacillota bacterium]